MGGYDPEGEMKSYKTVLCKYEGDQNVRALMLQPFNGIRYRNEF